MDSLQGAWEECERGEPSRRPFMDGYIQSATEEGLAPAGKHTLSLFCQYAPYELSEGTWEERRDEIGANIVETFAQYAPNLPGAVEGIEVLGPPYIEERIGITGGNIFHGEILPDGMFANRPVTGYGGYRAPVENLYLCGAGTWLGVPTSGHPAATVPWKSSLPSARELTLEGATIRGGPDTLSAVETADTDTQQRFDSPP
jgi:phytoene dehydrogenase-like protein